MNRHPIGILYLLLITVICSTSVRAQIRKIDYSNPVAALRDAFRNKNIDGLQNLLSEELKFGPIPADKSKLVLTNIVVSFPFLHSLEIVESKAGFALVNYSFEGSRSTESEIHFDESGKIVRIELVEQIVEREIEAKRSVPLPNPRELGKKYKFNPITFESIDGLQISANLYEVEPERPIILLCHQGLFNKFEYADIAPKLNQLGFNCLAIDQRSGGMIGDHQNETYNRALEEGINTDFLEAQRDIEASIGFLKKRYRRKIIIWGSSYSSILVLNLGNSKSVKAVISFSPSDFFKGELPLIEDVIRDLKKPYFITSSKKESEKLLPIMNRIKQRNRQIHFVPEGEGFHGSKTLWDGQPSADEYWVALTNFLTSIK